MSAGNTTEVVRVIEHLEANSISNPEFIDTRYCVIRDFTQGMEATFTVAYF